MNNTNHPDFPPYLTEKQDIEEVIGKLGFVAVPIGYERWVDGLKFTVCESFCCYFIVRDGQCDERRWCEPHELRIFSPVAPIELMATIYRLWAEVFEKRESEDFCLIWGKSWLDYQNELKRLIPPPPTLWAEREFLRLCLNYIDKSCDWTEEDYEVTFASIPGHLRLAAKNIELFCPARGNWVGEVSISAKELFRHLPKRFLGPAVMLQAKNEVLRIENRELRARWGDLEAEKGACASITG